MQNTENYKADNTSLEQRRNFIGGLWHGAFLALGVSLTQPTTVISAFVADLTGSTIWVGGLSTVLMVAAALPQLFVARWIEHRPLFYAGGGLGNIPYTDIIGKVIPAKRRGAFFGGKEALAGPLAVGAALGARQILAHVAYPNNYALLYALLFGLAALGLAIASLGFWIMKEPVTSFGDIPGYSGGEYWQKIRETSKKLKVLIIIELLTGFSLMALPFYVVFAREKIGAPPDAIGWFLLAQILGGVLANLLWARLVDRTGSRQMLVVCGSISTMTPLLAIALAPLGWPALLLVFFLAGATFTGRKVGFQSALLELAPAAERPTYAGLNAVLILPLAFLTLIAGVFLQYGSYTTLFIFASAFIAVGTIVAHRWVSQ